MNLGTTTGPLRCHHSLAQHVGDSVFILETEELVENASSFVSEISTPPESLPWRLSAIHSLPETNQRSVLFP